MGLLMNTKDHKQIRLNELYAPYQKCMQCPLGGMGRANVVFGEGNPDANLMFIGEAPGRDEDLQGRPFIGRSGQLLTKIMKSIGIKREEVFITNIVKCRPPGNRKPLANESGTCKNLLLFNQIKIIHPIVICTLGAASLEGLLEEPVKITKIRGKELIFEKTKLIPTLHPAYILRNPKALKDLTSDIEKAFKLTKKSTKAK